MAAPVLFHPDLALFEHIACRPEAELDLAKAALVLAEPEYPGLDFSAYLGVLDQLAAEARPRVQTERTATSKARTLVAYLCHDARFRGNSAEYDDPRNSFLNEVLDRRLGIPITLAVVMMEVGRRVEVPLAGISLPGHFVLRGGTPDEGGRGGVYLDPFDGEVLGPQELRELIRRTTGEARDPSPTELKAATKGAIVSRMLNNLRGIYAKRGDAARMGQVLDRLRALEASAGRPARGGAMLH